MGRQATVALYVAGDGSSYSRCGSHLLQEPSLVLGTADGECWNCLRVCSFLLEISQRSMIDLE